MGLVRDIGHCIVQVGDMEGALKLYRDVLGFSLPAPANPVWTVLTTRGGAITLYKVDKVTPIGEATPFQFHVGTWPEAARALADAGFTVEAEGDHSGVLVDPWGNRIGLHDHADEDD